MAALPLAVSALPALKPNHPTQHSRSQDRERHAVGGHRHVGEAPAVADIERRNQSRDACTLMHNQAAGEIENSKLRQPTAAPDPMAYGDVDEQEPQSAEEQ